MEKYTHGHHKSVVSIHNARTVEDSAAFLLPMLQPHFKLLDVGCGPGSITRGFRKHVKEVIGVDSSEDVISQAQECGDGVDFRVASAYQLPFEDNTFDVVYAHQVLQHLADPVAALKEMFRTLRPGGLVAVREVVYSTMHGAPVLPGIQKWRDAYMATARKNGSEPDAGLYLKQWLHSAGLIEVRYSTATVTYSSEDEDRRKAFGESWAERTLKTFGSQAVELGIAQNSDLSEMESAWKEWAADSSAVFLYVNGESIARKPES